MTYEELLPVINIERSAVQALLEKLTKSNTPGLKWQCEQALHYLGEAEQYSQPPNPIWEIVNIAMRFAKNHREDVENFVTNGVSEIQEIYPKSSI